MIEDAEDYYSYRPCDVCGGAITRDKQNHEWQDCIKSLKSRMNDELERIEKQCRENK